MSFSPNPLRWFANFRGGVPSFAGHGLLLAALAFVNVGCHHRANPPGDRKIVATPLSKSYVLAFPAMTYYDQSCAKCHGPEGSFYGPTLGNNLTDAQLIAKCRAMEAGPAGAPISEQANQAVVAYHRALIMRRPFVSLTQLTSGQWGGEASTDAKVTVHIAGRSIPADTTDWNWIATVPPGANPADATIDAQVDNKTTTLHLAQSPYSGTDPLPPAGQRHK